MELERTRLWTRTRKAALLLVEGSAGRTLIEQDRKSPQLLPLVREASDPSSAPPDPTHLSLYACHAFVPTAIDQISCDKKSFIRYQITTQRLTRSDEVDSRNEGGLKLGKNRRYMIRNLDYCLMEC